MAKKEEKKHISLMGEEINRRLESPSNPEPASPTLPLTAKNNSLYILVESENGHQLIPIKDRHIIQKKGPEIITNIQGEVVPRDSKKKK